MTTFEAPIEFAERLGADIPSDEGRALLAAFAGITGVTTTERRDGTWRVSGSGREVRVPVDSWVVKLAGIESPVVVPDDLYATYVS
jgi:hypothetical protein